MIPRFARPILLALLLGAAATGARADCESDMLQLEDAMKAPGPDPPGPGGLQGRSRQGCLRHAQGRRRDLP